MSQAPADVVPRERVVHRIGQPWAARALGHSPLRWAVATIPGVVLAWSVLTWPGGIAAPDTGAGTTLAWVALFAVLPLICVVDARLLIIPNRILLPVAALVAALLLLDALSGGSGTAALRALEGALICGGCTGLVWFIAPVGAIGLGDVKLSALAGAVLATQSLGMAAFSVLALPSMIGVIPAILIAVLGDGSKTKVPLGPFIAVATILGACYYSQIIDFLTISYAV